MSETDGLLLGPRGILARLFIVLFFTAPGAGLLIYLGDIPLQSAPGWIIGGVLDFVQDEPLIAVLLAAILVPFLFLKGGGGSGSSRIGHGP